jgi:hypothetical protein
MKDYIIVDTALAVAIYNWGYGLAEVMRSLAIVGVRVYHMAFMLRPRLFGNIA